MPHRLSQDETLLPANNPESAEHPGPDEHPGLDERLEPAERLEPDKLLEPAERLEPAEEPAAPFWQTKSLEAMTPSEWESLCDRCGKCCLVKLEDEDSGEIFLTDIACKLFDPVACSCSNYRQRRRKVRDCIKLTPESVRSIRWLPQTCAYRLIAEGHPLQDWHPLVSGSSESVHEAGVSVRGRTSGCEKTISLEDYPKHIVAFDK